jgi:hypothetical protein
MTLSLTDTFMKWFETFESPGNASRAGAAKPVHGRMFLLRKREALTVQGLDP